MQLSMFSSGAPPANHSALPDCGRAFAIRAATWPSSIWHWLTATGPAGWSGRMSPVSCHRVKGGILAPSSGGWQSSGMGSPTEFWTLNSCEHADLAGRSPNAGDVCSLSDILETGAVPQRYYLTAKACSGILHRVARRGKDLPAMLMQALQAVVDRG